MVSIDPHFGRRAVLAGIVGAAGAAAASAAPGAATAREGPIDVGGARLWHRDSGGDGIPVVLLHAATGSALSWDYQRGPLVRAGYRVIAYSRRGYWRSEIDAGADPGTGAGDLQRVAEALGLGRFHLVGLAAGGFIVPDYALSHPERLRSITIACSQGGATDPAFRARIAAIAAPGFAEMPATFRELGPSYRAADPAGVARWEAIRLQSIAGPRVMQRSENPLDWAAIERIRTPALMIAGAADLYMPPALMRTYAAHLHGCETAVLAESGHSGNWEDPDRFNAILLAFLRRHDGRR